LITLLVNNAGSLFFAKPYAALRLQMKNTPDKNIFRRGTEASRELPLWVYAVTFVVIAITVALVGTSESNQEKTTKIWGQLRESRDNLDFIEIIWTQLITAEAAQRGYLLTGEDKYLAPLDATTKTLTDLKIRIEKEAPLASDLKEHTEALVGLVFNKIEEVNLTVNLSKKGMREQALQILSTNSGQELLDKVRLNIAASTQALNRELAQRRLHMTAHIRLSRLSIIVLAFLNLSLLAATLYYFSQDLQGKKTIISIRESENQRLSATVAERTGELNELATHLQTSSEIERAALARDLHDELGGIMTAAMMDVRWVLERADSIPGGRERLMKCSALLDEAVSIKRRVIENLRPSLLDNLGLDAALEWYVSENCARGALAYQVIFAPDFPHLSSDASITLFRIVQESITNTLKYAKAKQVEVRLSFDKENIYLFVKDDGIGLPEQFNPNKLSHGLSGIKQRARAWGGEVQWQSGTNQGTAVTVSLPRVRVEDDGNI
jgi:signal transduction histidine kinase